MDYYSKYLKYKQKYLQLKRYQSGGGETIWDIIKNANDAAAAANAAANAAGRSREAELIRQGQFIVGYMRAATTRSCHTRAA